MHGRTGRRQILLVLERVCLAIAIACLGWYTAGRVTSARERLAAAQQLENALTPPGSSLARAASPEGAPAAMPRGALVGRIEIPRLGVSEAIRSGDDDETLDRAVGHLPDTPLPGERGNAALAGHRDTHFRALRNIRHGDRIVITTASGRHAYVVDDTRVVAPTEVSVLDPTPEPTLTLVTCHPFNFVGPAPNRFIVRARAAPGD